MDIRGFDPFDNKLILRLLAIFRQKSIKKKISFWESTRNEIGENLITSILSSIGAIFVSE